MNVDSVLYSLTCPLLQPMCTLPAEFLEAALKLFTLSFLSSSIQFRFSSESHKAKKLFCVLSFLPGCFPIILLMDQFFRSWFQGHLPQEAFLRPLFLPGPSAGSAQILFYSASREQVFSLSGTQSRKQFHFSVYVSVSFSLLLIPSV